MSWRAESIPPDHPQVIDLRVVDRSARQDRVSVERVLVPGATRRSGAPRAGHEASLAYPSTAGGDGCGRGEGLPVAVAAIPGVRSGCVGAERWRLVRELPPRTLGGSWRYG